MRGAVQTLTERHPIAPVSLQAGVNHRHPRPRACSAQLRIRGTQVSPCIGMHRRYGLWNCMISVQFARLHRQPRDLSRQSNTATAGNVRRLQRVHRARFAIFARLPFYTPIDETVNFLSMKACNIRALFRITRGNAPSVKRGRLQLKHQIASTYS